MRVRVIGEVGGKHPQGGLIARPEVSDLEVLFHRLGEPYPAHTLPTQSPTNGSEPELTPATNEPTNLASDQREEHPGAAQD